MKVKGTRANRVDVITLGCSKNIVDSEVLMGQLRGSGYDVTHESTKNDASIVIVNTCGFIDNAKQESVDTILRYADAKQDGLIDKLYVTGCLSQRYKDQLEVEIPQVDAYFGTLELPQLLKTLGANYQHELVGERQGVDGVDALDRRQVDARHRVQRLPHVEAGVVRLPPTLPRPRR